MPPAGDLDLDLPDAGERLSALASAVASRLSPDDAVRVAARRGESIAREAIASGSAPGDVLALLSADPDRRVRAAVAANRAAPASVLSELDVDSSPLVRRRVAHNVAAPAGAGGALPALAHMQGRPGGRPWLA